MINGMIKIKEQFIHRFDYGNAKLYMYGVSDVRLHLDTKYIYIVYNTIEKKAIPYMNHNGSLYYVMPGRYSRLYLDINNEHGYRLSSIFDPGNNVHDNLSIDIVDRFNRRSIDKIIGIIDLSTKELYNFDNSRYFEKEHCSNESNIDEYCIYKNINNDNHSISLSKCMYYDESLIFDKMLKDNTIIVDILKHL